MSSNNTNSSNSSSSSGSSKEEICYEWIKRKERFKEVYEKLIKIADNEIAALGPFMQVTCGVRTDTTYHKEWLLGVFCGEMSALEYMGQIASRISAEKKPDDPMLWLGVGHMKKETIPHIATHNINVTLDEGYNVCKQAIREYRDAQH